MTAITIGVINPAETEKVTMQVPDDVIVRDLQEAMIEQMGLPIRAGGQRLRYHLNVRADDGKLERLDDETTLAGSKVQEGNILQLTVEMIAGCFLAGTSISLSKGKYTSIENLKVGDKVLSYDTDKKELCDGIISDIYIGETDEYLIINDKLFITESHLVFSNEKWIQAKKLALGDFLITESGDSIKVTNIHSRKSRAAVYNLHLQTFTHTFFAEKILVHNMAMKAMLATQENSEVSHYFKTPSTPTEVNSDVLSIKIPMSASITLDEFFANVTDRMQSIDFIYSVFALLTSDDKEIIANFIRTTKQQVTQTLPNEYIHGFMTIANIELLRVKAIHYGSPATFDLLGIGNILEIVRDTIKDLAWRGQHEKAMASLELKNKQIEIQKNKIETEKSSTSHKYELEKTALEIESQRILIEKAHTDLLSQKIELLNKITNLNLSDDDKKVIVSGLLPRALTLANNPVTPITQNIDPYQLLFKPKD